MDSDNALAGGCSLLTLKLSSLKADLGRLDFEATLHVEAISGRRESGMDFFRDFYALRYLAPPAWAISFKPLRSDASLIVR